MIQNNVAIKTKTGPDFEVWEQDLTIDAVGKAARFPCAGFTRAIVCVVDSASAWATATIELRWGVAGLPLRSFVPTQLLTVAKPYTAMPVDISGRDELAASVTLAEGAADVVKIVARLSK